MEAQSVQYEFSEEQDKSISKLRSLMSSVGNCSIVFGAIYLVAFAVMQAKNSWHIAAVEGVMGVFFIMLGALTNEGAAAFKRITTTKGKDIDHLMGAISSLRRLYTALTVLFGAMICGGFALGILGLVAQEMVHK